MAIVSKKERELREKNKNKKQTDWTNINFLVGFATKISLIIGGVAGASYVGMLQFDYFKASKLNIAMVQVSGNAQELMGNAKLFPDFIFENAMRQKMMGDFIKNDTHGFDGMVKIGKSGMSGPEGTEFYITVHSIPERVCTKLIGSLQENFPVIAVGENKKEKFGLETGIYAKNVFGNREYSEELAQNICEQAAAKSADGKVNVTTWILKDTELKLDGVSLEQKNKTSAI